MTIPLKKKKLEEGQIDKNVEAISSLMEHWGWPQFAQVVQYMQGGLQTELFSKAFIELDPIQKDKRHASIVETVTSLERLLRLPEWLNNKRPSRWDQVAKYVIGKEQ